MVAVPITIFVGFTQPYRAAQQAEVKARPVNADIPRSLAINNNTHFVELSLGQLLQKGSLGHIFRDYVKFGKLSRGFGYFDPLRIYSKCFSETGWTERREPCDATSMPRRVWSAFIEVSR